MRTSKPISTISYNTPEYLQMKIEQWRNQGLIEFGMWVRHEPEEDEKKPHFHVFLKPAQLLQTMDLELDSLEVDPENIDMPLKMISFRISKEDDWLLYSLHDKRYLLEKGLTREFSYDINDVHRTCDDTFADIIAHVHDSRKGKLETRIYDCIKMGMKWSEIVASGLIPLRYMSGAKMMYDALNFWQDGFYRTQKSVPFEDEKK